MCNKDPKGCTSSCTFESDCRCDRQCRCDKRCRMDEQNGAVIAVVLVLSFVCWILSMAVWLIVPVVLLAGFGYAAYKAVQFMKKANAAVLAKMERMKKVWKES